MAIELSVVDAFADRPFSGNPAAVAILDTFPSDQAMQHVAREMNLSETAFVVPVGAAVHRLRWFTPSVEVDLCGHATLATAHLLGGEPVFETRSGRLSCAVGGDGTIEMDFPMHRPLELPLAGGFPIPAARWYGEAGGYQLVELPAATLVREFEPKGFDFTPFGRALVITAPGDRAGIDCVSRVFVPGAGVDEDPVTGSAHCLLAPFWSSRLGRDELVGEQASQRGGIVGMRCVGDRVRLSGRAVTVSRVRFEVPLEPAD